jgi:MFS family permease
MFLRCKIIELRMEYKYKVLTNTTLGSLLSALNATIVIISLPAIFKGIGINPFSKGIINLLLWIILSYSIVTSSLLILFGKASDLYGRKRFYLAGFTIFTIASVALSLTPNNSGIFGAYYIIVGRVIQAIGGGLIMVNSTVLLSDAFRPAERGRALGSNQIAFVVGNFLGIVIGGLLSSKDFHLIFLISVPFSIIGALWSLTQLKESRYRKIRSVHFDYLGNILLVSVLILFALGLSYALIPHGNSQLGWNNPVVLFMLISSAILFSLFVFVERGAKNPFINLSLFKIKGFMFGVLALFFNALATGALMFLLILWLQAIYLPLHNYSYSSTPFWSGIYMLPMLVAMSIFGFVGGILTDKHGSRLIATAGMIVAGIGLTLLVLLPADFQLASFFLCLAIIGVGMGLFAAPNTAGIMNSLPIDKRGEGNGIRQTISNIGNVISMVMFFTLTITIFTSYLPVEISKVIAEYDISSLNLSNLSPSNLLFASLLGYNPINTLPSSSIKQLSPQLINLLSSKQFLPSLLSQPFTSSLHTVFIIAIVSIFLGAILSWLRGNKKHS